MNKLKPALLGGLVVGLLSAIPIVNYCCCIWGIGGGGLSSYLYMKSSPTKIGPGDGAMLGGLAGIVGAIVYLIIGVPIAYFISGAQMEEAFSRANIHLPFTGFLLFLVSGLIGGLVLLVLAVIGGLIAVPIFEKRTDAPPPPPPQDFVG
ncbi:MAG TPA: hypothetical protein VHS05_24355 [Pyrinomonadaceae bacterium]|jgi:hypothetical protein|nr:hypothetical protein [Pyrinomonadaceae bacterium]